MFPFNSRLLMSLSFIGFVYKYLGIVDARDTDSNVHYSLDS